MHVVGAKARTISKNKAALIVKFISSPSWKDFYIQLFCTSLEPNTKKGQGANLSILTALTTIAPGAKSTFDLGVRSKPRSDTTNNMIAAFSSVLGGTFFDTSQASSDDLETSEQTPSGDGCHWQSFLRPCWLLEAHLTPSATAKRCEAP